jgi:hypothetical protein
MHLMFSCVIHHIFFISLNLVSVAWIASDNVLSDSIFKVTDIVSSLYEVLSFLTSRCSLTLLSWHTVLVLHLSKELASSCTLLQSLWEFLCHLHSEFLMWIFFTSSWSDCLLKVSASSFSLLFCNEFEIHNWLTVQLSKPVIDSTVSLLQSFSNSCDLCRSE